MTRMLTAISLASLLALVASGARAQEEDARTLFERGTRAVNEGRFADAEGDLTRSLSLAPRPATAFNLVVALEGLERFVRASELCDALLAERHGTLSVEQRGGAEARCAGVRGRVSRVVVRVTGERPLEIRVDGRVIGTIAAGAQLEAALDPGWHHVSASAEGHAPIERSLSLEPGDRTELTLDAPLESGSATSTGAPPATTTSEGPDLGLVLGLVLGGVAIVGGGIALGVVLSSGSPSPAPGDFAVVMTLAF